MSNSINIAGLLGPAGNVLATPQRSVCSVRDENEDDQFGKLRGIGYDTCSRMVQVQLDDASTLLRQNIHSMSYSGYPERI